MIHKIAKIYEFFRMKINDCIFNSKCISYQIQFSFEINLIVPRIQNEEEKNQNLFKNRYDFVFCGKNWSVGFVRYFFVSIIHKIMKRLENELEWQTQWIKTMPKTKSLTMCISLAVSSICSLNMLLYIMYLFIYLFTFSFLQQISKLTNWIHFHGEISCIVRSVMRPKN